MIHLRTFGLVDLRDADGSELAVILAQPKRLALLIYLAAARPAGVHRRDQLLALFWPELDEARARDALNQSLRFLRKALGSEVLIRRSAEDVGVDPGELWCDAAAFRTAAEEERWDDALDLYRADFLQGFFVDGGDGFERWMEEEREALRRLASRGARELARRHEETGALTLAISWGRRVLEFTPDDERAVRQLLALHVRAGDYAGALHLYDDFAQRLDAEWDTAPAPETQRLVEALRNGTTDELALIAGAAASDRNGSGPEPLDGLPVGALADRYRIEHELGTGGTAAVYLARDLKHDRDVALKVLLPEITEGLARDRFVREIRIAGRLQHPGIVPLFDSGEVDGRLYYVMPVVRGETLRRRLRRGPLALPEVLTILREVADSLGYAHDHGVVHRDIKPENILLVGPRAVVSDFGIARAAEAARTPAGADAMRLTRPGTSLGTPAYMSPEQAAGDPHITHLADLYSLGVLGYEMLAGRPPFTGSTPQEILAAKLTERPPDLLESRPEAPRWLADLLMRCLERDPTRRPQSARAIVTQLAADRTDAVGSRLPIRRVLRRAGLLIPSQRPAGRRWTLGVALTAALVVILWGAFSTRAAPVDPDLVAVLPFRVTGNGRGALEELREGVVDLTAIYLTGEQGGLRVVEPASLFRAWRERVGASDDVDPASRDAIIIARSLGAGWVLRGSLIGTGDDVLLRASLTPVGRGRAVQASVTGTADSLLAYVPRLLGRLVAQLDGMPADQTRSLTTTSLSAVRAYLAGQRHYRHGEYALAVDRFTEAIGLDTSFALAGLGLLMAHEWAGNASEAAERAATEVTWRHRSRLGARDRALIESVLGPSGPELSALAEVHRARVRATVVAPDRFESWYLLGDHLFHVGALLGIDRSLGLAEEAFERALTLDPDQAGVLQHLLLIAARRDDTAAVRSRWTAFRSTVPDPAIQFKDQWLVGQVLGDTVLTTEALARIDGSPAAVSGLSSLAFNVSLFPGLVSPLGDLLERVAPRFERREQRDILANLRWWLALDAGRPEDARRIRLATGAVPNTELALAQLFWGAGTAADTPPIERLRREPQECALGLAYALGGQWDRVREIRERISLPSPVGFGPQITAKQLQVCRAVLEAALAQGSKRPDARGLVLALDSLLTTVPYLQITWENLMVARLLEREGVYRRASRAAARYRRALGYPSYLSTSLREAGRLAALAGDREQAIAHFTSYLALRSDPEPALAAEAAEVRQALAQLTGSAP